MKIILSSRRDRYLAIFTIFLVMVALIAGMVGCGGDGGDGEYYNLTIASTAGGSVTTPGEGTFTYDEVTVVNLVAEAEEGYRFMKWTGNVGAIADANAAMTSVTMNGDYTITASFAKEIWDWDDLDAVRDKLNGIYILMDDLDSAANSGSGWQPIGNSTNPFTGTFDGQGCKISGLFINRPDEDDVGLFGYVEKGVIKNVGLVEADVTGGNHTGALVGYNERGTVGSDPTQPYSTYSTGNVTGSNTVGGLVGCNWAGTVSLSKSSADVRHVSSQCWRAGGLVGSNWGNVILCNYSGNVIGDHEVGGLVGLNGGLIPLSPTGRVISCQGEYTVTGNWIVGGEVGMNLGNLDSAIFKGNVNGVPWKPKSYMALNEGATGNSHSSDTAPQGSYVGALVGWNKGTINNCITVGNVSGDTYVGGLVGYNDYEGAVGGSFAAATVEGTAYFDPLAGKNDGTVTNSTSGTAADMMDIATFLGAGWDICAVAAGELNTACTWNIEPGGYPFLSGKQLVQYNLIISSTEGGKVISPGEGTFTYYEGSVVNLVAEAEEGYRFVNWTGDVGTVTNVEDAATTITMSGDYSVKANFKEGPPPGVAVRDWYDLDAVRDNPQDSYVLMNDLDSTTAGYAELASPAANGGKGWEPLATFYGSFDGDGHKIEGLVCNRPDEWHIGLFRTLQGGVIKNVGLVHLGVAGEAYVGGLVGGSMGTVSNSYSIGTVNGGAYVGGLVGSNRDTVSNSYSSGSVTGDGDVGGLVGVNYATVTDSYSTANVAGDSWVGGLVGWNEGTVSNCYSTGSVTGLSNGGGLVGGERDGTVSYSFWDTQTSGQATSAGGTGKTTAEMQNIATFSGAGWNIIAVANPGTRNPSYIWNIVNGVTYPFLRWQS